MDTLLQKPVTVREDWKFGRYSVLKRLPAMSTLTWFEVLGYSVLLEADLASERHQAERHSYTEVVLRERLSRSLQQMNPEIPEGPIAAAMVQLTAPLNGNLLQKNHQVHSWLTQGMPLQYRANGQTVNRTLQLLDRSHLLNNDWLVIHPFPVTQGQRCYCLDLVVFINGLPLVVIQGLHPHRTMASLEASYRWLQTYKQTLPMLLLLNCLPTPYMDLP